MLNENENGPDELFNKRVNAIFFGIYWKNPQQFEFGRGDRKFVRELAMYVKSKVDTQTENEGIEYFHRTDNGSAWMKKLFSTSMGLFFGSIPTCSGKKSINKAILTNQINEVSTSLSIETLEANLLSQIEEINAIYAENGIKKMQSSVAHVTVIGNSIKGSVVCCFCEKDEKGSAVKIYYQKSSKSGSWVKSNYIKHLSTVHGQPTVRKLMEKSKKPVKSNTSNGFISDDSIIEVGESISSNTNQATNQNA